MKRWIVALVAGLVLLVVGGVLRQQQLPGADRFVRYYLNAFCLATLLFCVYALAQLVYRLRVPLTEPTPPGPDPANKRDSYRIAYEPGQGPRLRITHPRHAPPQQDGFEVLDLSEGGLSFANPDRLDFTRPIQGALHFFDGRRTDISGKVLRADGPRVTIKLLAPLPPDLVMAEQRRLITGEQETS